MFLFPLLWLILGAVLLVSLTHAWTSFRNRAGDAASHDLDRRVFQKYGPIYLGFWSPSDEAINGLGNTMRLDGDVTPKWQGAETSALSRLAAICSWPRRALYNAVFARAIDELIWDRVSRRLQSGCDSGRLFAEGCGLGIGANPGHAVAPRCSRAGNRRTATAARPRSPFRSRRAIRFRRLREDAAQASADSQHEPPGEPLRQRQLRELYEDAEAGRDLRQRVCHIAHGLEITNWADLFIRRSQRRKFSQVTLV